MDQEVMNQAVQRCKKGWWESLTAPPPPACLLLYKSPSGFYPLSKLTQLNLISKVGTTLEAEDKVAVSRITEAFAERLHLPLDHLKQIVLLGRFDPTRGNEFTPNFITTSRNSLTKLESNFATHEFLVGEARYEHDGIKSRHQFVSPSCNFEREDFLGQVIVNGVEFRLRDANGLTNRSLYLLKESGNRPRLAPGHIPPELKRVHGTRAFASYKFLDGSRGYLDITIDYDQKRATASWLEWSQGRPEFRQRFVSLEGQSGRNVTLLPIGQGNAVIVAAFAKNSAGQFVIESLSRKENPSDTKVSDVTIYRSTTGPIVSTMFLKEKQPALVLDRNGTISQTEVTHP